MVSSEGVRFYAYGLIDPRVGRVFYVGQSGDLKSRLISHHSCDPANRSYRAVLDIRETGLRFQYCIFGEFQSRREAMRLERILILTLDGLLNSPVKGMLSTKIVPITSIDHEMLASATRPLPIAQSYSSLVEVREETTKPMVHHDWAYL